MTANDILIDAFGRIEQTVNEIVHEMNDDDLSWRPSDNANSIAWLIWHMGRVIDAQLSPLNGLDEVWTSKGWFEKFALPFDTHETGYGMSSKDVARVQATADNLIGYYTAAHNQIVTYINTLDPETYDDIIDTNWNPPVTRGARLVSILDDCAQHIGQAAYVKGLHKSATVI